MREPKPDDRKVVGLFFFGQYRSTKKNVTKVRGFFEPKLESNGQEELMKIYLMDMIRDSRERQRERLRGAALGGKNVYTLTGKTAMDGRFEVIGEQQYYFGGTPMTHKLWIIWDYAAGSHLHLDFGGTWFRAKKDAVEALAEIAERVMQSELDDELRVRLKKPLPEPVQAWW